MIFRKTSKQNSHCKIKQWECNQSHFWDSIYIILKNHIYIKLFSTVFTKFRMLAITVNEFSSYLAGVF